MAVDLESQPLDCCFSSRGSPLDEKDDTAHAQSRMPRAPARIEAGTTSL